MDIPYESERAKTINKLIFETIYHAALQSSNELSKSRLDNMKSILEYKEHGVDIFTDYNDRVCRDYLDDVSQHKAFQDNLPIPAEIAHNRGDLSGSYSSFIGSPASKGILQFDMWNVTPSERYDWELLKNNIKQYGLRNSLLLAPMPTASTAQILGNNECFEPLTSNIYSRRTLAGDYVLPNKYLMKELIDLNLWSDDLKNSIIENKGSIQHIDGIPQNIKDKYKIVWEISQRHLIDMAADRGAFICQSQSLNLWLEDPDYKTLTAMHFYGWEKGLKTGIYYLRRKPKHQPQQFTIVPTQKKNNNEDEDNSCEMCSG
jgi:ribonucleotide reductase alpha subunit